MKRLTATLTVFTVILGGCAVQTDQRASLALKEEYPEIVSYGEESSEPAPFDLELVDDLNDGEQLFVRGRVLASTDRALDKTFAVLTGFAEGGEQTRAAKSLEELIGRERMQKGEDAMFTLALPVDGLSDYKLALAWGKDAEQFLDTGARVVLARLRQTEVERLYSCEPAPCKVHYRISSELVNEGTSPLNQAKLAIGFVPVDMQSSEPEEEEFVELKDLALAEGQFRTIRIALEEQVSEEVSKRFTPKLRIAGYE